MFRIGALLLAASVALPSAAQDLSLCSWTHEATGATFDVSGLNVPQLRSVGYRVKDGRDNSFSGNYTYLFNVCGNLDMDFYEPANRRQCNATYNAGNELNTELAGMPTPAVQINTGDSVTSNFYCHKLGAPVSNETLTYSLLRPNNPARGIRLTYSGGDDCGGGAGKRSFTLAMQCADDAGNQPDTTETVEETSTCAYETFFRTAYGCPQQCPVVGPPGQGRLCNGQGVCDLDAGSTTVKCFCNAGWHGAGCDAQITEEKQPAVTGITAVLIVVCIVLVCAGALLWVLWNKVASLRLDMSAYKSLAEEDSLHSPAPTLSEAAPQ